MRVLITGDPVAGFNVWGPVDGEVDSDMADELTKGTLGYWWEMEMRPLPDDDGFAWYQPDRRGFHYDDADFYEPGPVVSIHRHGRVLTIEREGETRIEHTDGRVILDAGGARMYFRDGKLPDMALPQYSAETCPGRPCSTECDHQGTGWWLDHNGWFAEFVDGELVDEHVTYSLTESLGFALDHLDRLASNTIT